MVDIPNDKYTTKNRKTSVKVLFFRVTNHIRARIAVRRNLMVRAARVKEVLVAGSIRLPMWNNKRLLPATGKKANDKNAG